MSSLAVAAALGKLLATRRCIADALHAVSLIHGRALSQLLVGRHSQKFDEFLAHHEAVEEAGGLQVMAFFVALLPYLAL